MDTNIEVKLQSIKGDFSRTNPVRSTANVEEREYAERRTKLSRLSSSANTDAHQHGANVCVLASLPKALWVPATVEGPAVVLINCT